MVKNVNDFADIDDRAPTSVELARVSVLPAGVVTVRTRCTAQTTARSEKILREFGIRPEKSAPAATDR